MYIFICRVNTVNGQQFAKKFQLFLLPRAPKTVSNCRLLHSESNPVVA